MFVVDGKKSDLADFGEILHPEQASEPILSKPVRSSLMEWLTEIWACARPGAVRSGGQTCAAAARP